MARPYPRRALAAGRAPRLGTGLGLPPGDAATPESLAPLLTQVQSLGYRYWLPPSGDITGVIDTYNIRTLIDYGVPYLAPGRFYVNTGLVSNSGTVITGSRISGGAGHLSSQTWGTVLVPVSTWTQGSAPEPAVITLPDGSNGCGVASLAIDSSQAPAGVDQIASLGAAESVTLRDLVLLNSTGQGINQYTGTGSPANCDGWAVDGVMIQSPTGVGVTMSGFDQRWNGLHVQNGGSDGIVLTGRHNKLTDSRADVCAGWGFRANSPYSSSSNDSNELNNCGTQFNALGAVLADTSNTCGLVISGGTFDGDGTSSAGSNPQAAVVVKGGWVTGWWNTLVTAGAPLYALATISGGSAAFVATDGGEWNAVTGPVLDSQGLAQAIGIGPMTRYSSANGAAIGTGSARFGVTGAMTAGSVTITNPWITATSRIIYSRKTAGGTLGQLSISSQTAGQAVIVSSSGTETSTIEYMVVSQ